MDIKTIHDRCNGCRTCSEQHRDPPCLRCRALAAVVKNYACGRIAMEEQQGKRRRSIKSRATEIRMQARIEMGRIYCEFTALAQHQPRRGAGEGRDQMKNEKSAAKKARKEDPVEESRVVLMEAFDALSNELTDAQRIAFFETVIDTLQVELEAERAR